MNSKFFYKVMANFYDLLDVVYFRNYKTSPRKAALEMLHSEDRILDLCTGTATNAMNIAQTKPYTRIVGIDISKDMFRVAKDKLIKKNIHNVKLYCMDATKMRFKSECFDKVLLSLVLHELDEVVAEQIITEAKRVLKENGEIVITEWEPSSKFWQKILFTPVHVLEPKSYRTFVKKDLYSYFERYGLRIVEERHCDYTKVLRVRKSSTTNNYYSLC